MNTSEYIENEYKQYWRVSNKYITRPQDSDAYQVK